MTAVFLPPLPYRATPNRSLRNPPSRKPSLIVLHSWGSPAATSPVEARQRFAGVTNYLCDPDVQVSAHVVYGGKLGDPDGEAVQLVPWDQKAWTQAGLNSACLSVESADAIWRGHDEPGFLQLARIVAFWCHKTKIAPIWTVNPAVPGVTRHVDLGPLGNPSGHVDPTLDVKLWRRFVEAVRLEHVRGGFRPTWGRGEFRPL